MPPQPSIQSVQNSMVKHAYSLKVPKKAKDSEDFLCEGFHLVREALQAGLRCRFIFGTPEAYKQEEGRKILEEAHRAKTKCFEVPSKIIAYVSDTVTPQGLLAVVGKPLVAWPGKPFSKVLAVYQVQDAGNIGTLFRSAEASGAQGILLTEGCCDPFNPKAVRASMGSLFRLPFQVGGNWNAYMDWLKQNDFRSYGLATDGTKSLTELDFLAPQAFWVGSEGAGLPEELLAACDEKINIPMAGKVESLNVGVAASLALFWARWRRPVP
jgi:RNA methyltransferase, TrmH family